MSFTSFKVLTFDVVGTLIDFEGGIINYIRRLSGKGPAELGDDAILEAYRRSRSAAGAGPYPEDLVRVYRDMADALTLPRGRGAGEGLRDSIKDWPAFPDSVEALKRLHKRFRLVAMTNARRWALDQMARTLGEPFDDGVTPDETGCEKPDPAFFADIGVAKRLGYTVCWIERRKGLKGFGGTQDPGQITKPDFHFATLGELADAVEAG